MSLTQLQAYYQPWLKRRSLKKELYLFWKSTNKSVRLQIRKTKSKSLQIYRSQYFLNTALADAKTAATRNEDIVISMTVLSVIIGYSTAALALDILITAFSAIFTFSEITKIDSSIFILLALVCLAVIGSWLAAFSMNLQSIALMDGANRKRTNNIRNTVRRSLKLTSRIAQTWALMGLVLLGIPAAGAMVTALYLSQTTITMLGILEIAPYAVIATITWMMIILMEYSLLPYIALFEPNLSLRQSLTRSHELISYKGRIFIVMAYVVLGIALSLAYIAALKIEAIMGIHRGIHFFGYALLIVLVFNAVMTAFYRKRKLARKR